MASALEEAQESEASLGEWFSDADFCLCFMMMWESFVRGMESGTLHFSNSIFAICWWVIWPHSIAHRTISALFSTLVLWYCGWISNMSKFQKTKNSVLLFSGCVETSEAIVLIAPPPLVYNNFVIRWAFPTTLQDFFGQKKTFTENRKPLLFLCFKVKCLNQERHYGPTSSHTCLQVLS